MNLEAKTGKGSLVFYLCSTIAISLAWRWGVLQFVSMPWQALLLWKYGVLTAGIIQIISAVLGFALFKLLQRTESESFFFGGLMGVIAFVIYTADMIRGFGGMILSGWIVWQLAESFWRGQAVSLEAILGLLILWTVGKVHRRTLRQIEHEGVDH
jgi:predicted histidine transporter YuiF (NhaC family)